MKRINIRYSHEQMQTLGRLASDAAVRLMAEPEVNVKLRGVLLGRMAMRIAERMAYPKEKYNFNYPAEEALAFYISYDTGDIVSLNNWTIILLNQTYHAIHKAFNL